MNAPAIISGDFSTFRHVQGRKVLQLVIEVPSEQAASVFSTFGYPGSGNPIPVAVARLDPTVSERETVQKERRAFTEMSYAQQAALRCNEPQFWRFLEHRQRVPEGVVSSASDAAAAVRLYCGVNSRSDICDIPSEPMGTGFKWRSLEAEYFAWQRGRR